MKTSGVGAAGATETYVTPELITCAVVMVKFSSETSSRKASVAKYSLSVLLASVELVVVGVFKVKVTVRSRREA